MAGGKNSHVSPRFDLLSGDLLRIGYEDRPGHYIYKVGRSVPRHGRLHLKISPEKMAAKGTPVFLIDRMEPSLSQSIREMENVFGQQPEPPSHPVKSRPLALFRKKTAVAPREMDVYRFWPRSRRPRTDIGLWLSGECLRQAAGKNGLADCWLWLPPVIWQEDSEAIQGWIDQAVRGRARRFVINAPWQMALFKHPESLEIWAGPFCNLTNPLSLGMIAGMGCAGAIVSPELAGADFLLLGNRSSLPLGIVVGGSWPLCLARTAPADIEEAKPFFSPRKESARIVKNDGCFWVYPEWPLDILERRSRLEKNGYSMFVRLVENLPEAPSAKKRPGDWNWETGLA
jgi:putative protease